MDPDARGLIIVGALLVAGLAIDLVGRRTRLPRVSLLVLLGAIAGPLGFDLLGTNARDWFPVISAIALVMVGFLLGGEFSLANVREQGRLVFVFAVIQATITALVVAGGLLLLGVDVVVALSLGGIAVATDPTAVVAVVKEAGARGRFTRRLLGVVAVDDVIGMGLFSLLVVLASAVSGEGSAAGQLALASREVFGAIILGLVLGLPVAYLSGRLRPGTPTLEEALGAVLLCAGLALWLEVSFLLAAVVMGAVVTNLAQHHTQTFREIESIEWPFLVVFFVLAGASVDVEALEAAGLIGLGYLVLRVLGKLTGGAAGARAIGSPPDKRAWYGMALLPQAGVALGLALLASDRFPDYSNVLLAVVVGATLVFEMVGPVLVRLALRRVGEADA